MECRVTDNLEQATSWLGDGWVFGWTGTKEGWNELQARHQKLQEEWAKHPNYHRSAFMGYS